MLASKTRVRHAFRLQVFGLNEMAAHKDQIVGVARKNDMRSVSPHDRPKDDDADLLATVNLFVQVPVRTLRDGNFQPMQTSSTGSLEDDLCQLEALDRGS